MSKVIVELLALEAFVIVGGSVLIGIGVNGIRNKSIGRPPRMYVGVTAQAWGAAYICLGLSGWAMGVLFMWFWAHGKLVA